MPHNPEPSGSFEDEEACLNFLRDEGLDMLAQFKGIGNEQTRQLLRRLVRVIAAGQPASTCDEDE